MKVSYDDLDTILSYLLDRTRMSYHLHQIVASLILDKDVTYTGYLFRGISSTEQILNFNSDLCSWSTDINVVVNFASYRNRYSSLSYHYLLIQYGTGVSIEKLKEKYNGINDRFDRYSAKRENEVLAYMSDCNVIKTELV